MKIHLKYFSDYSKLFHSGFIHYFKSAGRMKRSRVIWGLLVLGLFISQSSYALTENDVFNYVIHQASSEKKLGLPLPEKADPELKNLDHQLMFLARQYILYHEELDKTVLQFRIRSFLREHSIFQKMSPADLTERS
jgi:hypothetical protein